VQLEPKPDGAEFMLAEIDAHTQARTQTHA